MTGTIDAQGFTKVQPKVVQGMIVAFYGARCPSGWAICDGTNGTPNLVDRLMIGDTAVGSGTAAGAASPVTGLVHSGFALTNHSDHGVTQPAAHSNHGVTQPAAHSNHVITQPATHATHVTAAGHTHDAHTASATGGTAVAGVRITGPVGTHASGGGHTHDAHPAHAGWNVDAHSAHSAFAVDAHSGHSAFAVDAHSAHSITAQATTHVFKHIQLAWIMKN